MAAEDRCFVGTLAEFPLNQMRILDVQGRSIGVVQTPEGVYAIRNNCPHHGAPICKGAFGGTVLPSQPDQLEFGMENRVIRCPWHLWEYDIVTGEALFGTNNTRLVTYRTEVQEGEVFLHLRERAGQGRRAKRDG